MSRRTKRAYQKREAKLSCKECGKRKVAAGHTYCTECLLDLYKSEEVRLK